MTLEHCLQTELHDWHQANGGRLVDFAGWAMPIQYRSIIDEHVATRTKATLFDVSHMGRIDIRGSDAESFIDGLTTRKIAGMAPGRIRYSLVCNEDGGILDDILVYNHPSGAGEYLLVVNASNREKILAWLEQHRQTRDVQIDDRTTATTMIAVQGPLAVEIVQQHLQPGFAELKYFQSRIDAFDGQQVLVSRTGYTGEDGCELIVDRGSGATIWEALAAHDQVSPAGLGARDTLRLEAAMPLYGHELTEEINAADTDLGFALSLKDREFIGRDAIQAALEDPSRMTRAGFLLEGKRAAREGSEILLNGKKIGYVTSGTFSPTLQRPIAMGYIQREHLKLDTEVSVDVRGRTIPGVISKLPFYKR